MKTNNGQKQNKQVSGIVQDTQNKQEHGQVKEGMKAQEDGFRYDFNDPSEFE